MRLAPRVTLLVVLAGCAAAPAAGPDPAPQSRSAAPASVDVEFAGNTSIAGFRLRRVIADPLSDFAKDPTRESALLDAAIDLTDHYQSEGFPDAVVQHELRRSPLRVVFRVHEGRRVTVSELHLEGNHALGTERLLGLWTRRKTGLLGTGDPLFVEEELRGLAAAIRGRYRDEGWLEVVVRGPLIERPGDGRHARVRYVVEEGPRYRFGAISIAPALGLAPGAAGENPLVGAPFRDADVYALRLRVRRVLEDQGHPEPQVRVAFERAAAQRLVKVAVDGEVTAPVRVVAIAIQGNRRTANALIRSKIQLAVDQLFHGGKLEASVADLYRTGLFRTVQVQREDPAPGQVRLVFVVEEEDARDLSLMVGYGSYELLRGAVVLGDHNLFGSGQSLNLGARASFKGYRGDLTWTEPELLRSRTALSASTFYQERVEPGFTDDSVGTTVALKRKLLPFVQGRLGYTIDHRNARDVDPSVSLGADDEYRTGTAFLELTRDTRDSQLFPTHGHQLTLKYERSDPALLGTLSFDRVTARGALILDLGRGFNLGLGLETGAIWSHQAGLLPVQERFFNGGESSVRSFRESQLGPQSASGEPTGGEFKNTGSVELRVPIVGILDGALFADTGNVGTPVEAYGLNDLRHALGTGLRLQLPIGPLRLDLGINPDPRRGEDRYALHLSVGFPF